MDKKEITLEEAENYIDNIYQHKFDDIEEIKEDGTRVIYIGGLKDLKFSDFEKASFRLLRGEQRLKYENKQLKEKLNKIEEPKKIEKIEIYDNSIDWCMNGRAINDTEKELADKINELIEHINKLEKGDGNE